MSGSGKPTIFKGQSAAVGPTPEIRYQPIAPYGNPPPINPAPEGRRIVRACDECRRKKIKCFTISNSTSCKNCISYKKGCTYNTRIKKRGPPRGYTNVLEDRLKRIEGLIDSIKPESGQSPSKDEDENQEQPSKKPRISYTSNALTKSDEVTMMESLRNSQLTAEGRFISKSNISCIFEKMNLLDKENLSKYGIAIQHNENNDYFHIKRIRSSEDKKSDQIKQLIEMGFMKPDETITTINEWIWKVAGIDKQLSDRLLKIYFAYIHPLLPVVNKVSFLQEYRGIQSSFPAGPLLNAMYGAAVRYIENCKKFDDSDRLDGGKPWDLPENLSERLFATLIVFIQGRYVPCLSSIQAIVIGHNHSVGLESWTSGWLLNCIAVRMSQDIGLHRSSDGWNISQQEKETRRMVWWSVYILDRWFSSGTGRPLTAFDEDCDELYPSENVSMDNIMDSMTKKDQHLPRFPSLAESVAAKVTGSSVPMNQPFLHLLKLSEILGRILQGLYTPQAKKHSAIHGSDAIVAYLDNALSNWRASLPPLLDLSSAGKQSLEAQDHMPLLSMSGLLCLSYCTLLILLHRPFIEKSEDNTNSNDSRKRSSQSALAICTSAAIRIIEVSESMHYRDFLMVSWGFALYPVFTASLIHIHNSSNDDTIVSDVAKSNLVRAFAVVEKLGMLSPMATGMGGVLKRVVSLNSHFTDHPNLLNILNIPKPSKEITCKKTSRKSAATKTIVPRSNTSSQRKVDRNADENLTKDSLVIHSQGFPNIVNVNKEGPMDMQHPSLDDGDWINQLYTPIQPTFKMKDKVPLENISSSSKTTPPINFVVQQKQQKNHIQQVDGFDIYSIQQFGFNTIYNNVASQSQHNITPQTNESSEYKQTNTDYDPPVNFPSSVLLDFEDFMLPQFYSTPGLNIPGKIATHDTSTYPHTTPMKNNDPEALFKNRPDNPFWGVPSSMEADDWHTYLLPYQQQVERQQQ